MSTSRPETSTSSWGIAPNILRIKPSRLSSAIPFFGQRIHDSLSSYSSPRCGGRSFAFCDSRTAGLLPRPGVLHGEGRAGPHRICGAGPTLLCRTCQEKKVLFRIDNAMGRFECRKVKGLPTDSVDQRFSDKSGAARGVRGIYETW